VGGMMGMGVCAAMGRVRARVRRRVFMWAPIGMVAAGPPVRMVRIRMGHPDCEVRFRLSPADLSHDKAVAKMGTR
jgi:hypothetical protein